MEIGITIHYHFILIRINGLLQLNLWNIDYKSIRVFLHKQPGQGRIKYIKSIFCQTVIIATGELDQENRIVNSIYKISHFPKQRIFLFIGKCITNTIKQPGFLVDFVQEIRRHHQSITFNRLINELFGKFFFSITGVEKSGYKKESCQYLKGRQL